MKYKVTYLTANCVLVSSVYAFLNVDGYSLPDIVSLSLSLVYIVLPFMIWWIGSAYIGVGVVLQKITITVMTAGFFYVVRLAEIGGAPDSPWLVYYQAVFLVMLFSLLAHIVILWIKR